MATVTTTFRLNDQMSGRLRDIDRGLKGLDSGLDKAKGSSVTFGVVAGGVITSLIGKVSQLVADIPKMGDEFVLLQARLGLITQEGENVTAINDKIFQSAQRAKGAYMDTANSIAKLGLLAGEAFNNTDEIIAFAELMNKSFKVGGAGIQEQTAGMYQLTQAMASGKLQGDEFRSIMENAPMLAGAIAKFTGKSKGELKEMSAEGTITADIIKGALFSASDDINSKFDELPDTWDSTMQSLKNKFQMAFGGMMGYLGGTVAGGIESFVTFLMQNADVVIAMLVGIGTVITAILIPKIIAMAGAIWTATIGWLAMHMPVVIIGAAVAGLLILFLKFPEVFGVIAGVANTVFDSVLNWVKVIANAINSVVNLAIAGLNKLGADIKPIEMMEYVDVTESYGKGKDWATGKSRALAEKIKGMKDSFAVKTSGTPRLPNGTKGASMGDLMGGLNGINEKLDGKGSLKSAGDVKITDDNLKWLLDIASIKQQKAYQKAPISISVSTGDINSGTDEKKLLKKLENIVVDAYHGNLAVE